MGGRDLLATARSWWRSAFRDPGRLPPRGRRLLVLTPSLPSDVVGGTQVQAERTAACMSGDFDVLVLCRALRVRPGVEDRQTYRVLRRPVSRWPGLRALVDVVLLLWQLRRLVASNSVLLAYITITNGLVAAVAGRWLGCPSIVFIRAEVEYQGDLRNPVTRVLSWLSWALADRVLLQSAILRGAFLQRAAALHLSPTRLATKLGVVPNGIELPDVAGSSGAELIFVGRLHPMKGLHVLLNALREIEPSSRPRLGIIGDGPLLPSLRAAATDLPVEFLGELGRDEALERLSRAGIFAFPATGGDGMPNAVLEAMALGLAVITTPVAAIPELIQDGQNGLLVPIGSSAALGDAIVRLVQDPDLRRRLGTQARATVAAMSWENVRQRLMTEIQLAAEAAAARSRTGRAQARRSSI